MDECTHLTWSQLLPSCIGGPQTPLMFIDLPEGLTGLRKAVILVSWFIIVKARRWKSAQGRGNGAESRRNRQKF